MATEETTPKAVLQRSERWKDLQELFRQEGLDTEYWLPKFLEQLGVNSAHALKYLDEKDLQKLKAQTQHSWEKRALEKLLNTSYSNSLSELEKYQVEKTKKKQKTEQDIKQTEQEQELRDLWSEESQQEEEREGSKELAMWQATEIPKDSWQPSKMFRRDVIENRQQQLNLTKQTLSPKQNLTDRELMRWASGGLALQGIYKTSSQSDLLERREELLSVPEEFSFFGPGQGTRMETKEFISSQTESIFTRVIEKLGFSMTTLDKEIQWTFSLETGIDHNKFSESKETYRSHSESTYFCSVKFYYVPLVSCHFAIDQLQFSKSALRELKYIEDLQDHAAGPDRISILRYKAEKFFQRFGSHANRGPLHLGGIYWWKAISEGFQSEQLKEVKDQSIETLENYVRESYTSFGIKLTTNVGVSSSHSSKAFQNNFKNNIQLSMAQTGGPPNADNLIQWKVGLVSCNQNWFVIDRGLQLVPIWDIIVSNHKKDFKDPVIFAKCLKDCYTQLTRITAHVQQKDLVRDEKDARVLLDIVKSWDLSDAENKLKKLIEFMQKISDNGKGYGSWINICLTDCDLQNFLINIVSSCKQSLSYSSRLIKSQLRSLLYPHIYSVESFPQASSIMQWIFQPESPQIYENISQFSELVNILKEAQICLAEVNAKSPAPKVIEDAQRKVTFEVSLSLGCFLNYLQESHQSDTQLLLLAISIGAGFNMANNTFQYLLGYNELDFLLNEMQTVYNKYQDLKHICSYRAQAFLVLTGLTATVGDTDISPEEKDQRLTLIKQRLGQSLTKEVNHILTKLEQNYDWKMLEKDLKLLTNGNYEAITTSLEIYEGKKQLKTLSHEFKQACELHDSENYKCKIKKNGSFLELLERLGLKDNFPKRINRADFHLIYKNSVYNTQPNYEKELPFFFLQRLFMLDYRFRYLVFKNDRKRNTEVLVSGLNQENISFDLFEDIFEMNNAITNPLASNPSPHINPMDIQMAILHCADDFARQFVLGKLSICQFALPLLVPNPCSPQIEFYLWSLRPIRRSWQQKKKLPTETHSYKNQLICHVPTPIVSFMRVGNNLSASKSQIMNCLLSKHKHDIFFHRHCKGSRKDCLLMKGVVEISWFCPTGEGEDRFDKCLTFTNLHGNAKEYQQQLTFLQEVSSLIVLLLSTCDDNKESQNFVQQLFQSSKPVILLLDDKENTVTNNSAQRVNIGIKNRNEAEVTEELTNAIKSFLNLSETAYSLQDCAEIARTQGFLIDEDQGNCQEAKEKAEYLITLLQEMEISQLKKNLLPLQGQLLHLWYKEDKELYHLKQKVNRSFEQHKSVGENDKQIMSHEQSKGTFPLNDLMRSFLQNLQAHSENHTNIHFVQWLTMLLDNLTTEYLQNLNEKKNTLWLLVQTEKQTSPNSTIIKCWESDIEAISREIGDCSLGIEHFFRELGQIFEALEEMSPDKDTEALILSLPQIVADLMISGIPVELVNGDAFYMPLKWVAAVLDKVIEKLGDKKLFVLSILSTWNSEKSTLLSALLGLHFTFKARKYTRGAYMHLLKVEDTFAEELGFEFLLVVDTEGLWAPELSNKSQIHDSGLATFVIGLANLTLINILGENSSEIQDILQIFVQTHLKMKEEKSSPSCLFVHQNIEEIPGKVQTIERQRRLAQRLDEVTAAAAENEQYSDIACFTDVITFDVNTQVHYFAHLWDGNPLMVPPSICYSQNVQELKHRIFEIAKQQSRDSIMNISGIKQRVQDLWRASVDANFILSFRNSQEFKAMNKLETMYSQWTWDLRSYVLDLQDQMVNQIQNRNIQILTVSTLVIPVTEKYKTIKQKLEKYCNADPDNKILLMRKTNFEDKLRILKEALLLDIQRKFNEMMCLKKSQEILDNKISDYEKELLKGSQELALTVKGRKLSNQELHEKFDQLWGNWFYDVASDFYQIPEPNIDDDSEHILLQHFNKEKSMVGIFEGKYEEKFQINYKKHIQINKKYFWNIKLENYDKESIHKTTDCIVSRCHEVISNIKKQHNDYHSYYFHKILRIVEEEVKSAHTQERYTFTSKYKFDLCLSLFSKASQIFKEMHRIFKRDNNPVNYLEKKKIELYSDFKISCQEAISIKIFVDFVWHKLTPAISNTIWGKMSPKVAWDMQVTCPQFNGNKANLEKYILISLAEEESFDKYWQYLQNPRSFYKRYIENHVKLYYSSKGSEKLKTFLKITLNDIKTNILSAISETTVIAKEKSGAMPASEWLDLFCDHLGNDVILPRKDLIRIEHQDIRDIDFLKELMNGALESAMKTVEQICLSVTVEEMIPEIRKIISKQLCGCWELCPRCGAICTHTIPAHEGDHNAVLHRPRAVIGGKWYKTNYFSIDSCTNLMANDCSFVLEDNRDISYKNFKQAGGVYATWNITPDSSSQLYWKWFVCHFRSKLEKIYNLKFEGCGQIPATWFKITKQNVINDLEKQ